MNKYMVTVRIAKKLDEKFYQLIPLEKEKGKELITKGIVDKLYISKDHSDFWTIINGENTEFVEKIMQELPLYDYLEYKIYQLDI